MVDLCVYYADLGRGYGEMLRNVAGSFKQHHPGCRTVLLTPNPECDGHEAFDMMVTNLPKATAEDLCFRRAQAIWSWMTYTLYPAVISDPDILFLKPVPWGNFDVGLLWRGKVDQRVNSGVVLAKPGNDAFWRHYAGIVTMLPEVLRPWYIDQLPFSLLTGLCHEAGETLLIDNAKVHLLDMATNCPKSDHPHPDAWAVHYKGTKRKEGKWAA